MASLEPDAAIASAGSTYPISVAARVPEWIKAQQLCSSAQQHKGEQVPYAQAF